MSEETQTQETQEEQTQETQTQDHWTKGLADVDLQGNPTMQKYASPEDAHRGHLELVKTLGKDRIVWPADENDEAGWANIHEKLGVPKESSGYDLEAVQMPEGGGAFNKAQFQEILKSSDASKKTGDVLWKAYTDSLKGAYSAAATDLTSKTNAMIATLKQEWGEAYDTNRDRGQSVIDTFAGDTETAEFLTAQLQGDARGQRFLADLGSKFSESSIGGFQNKPQFTLTPDQAKEELATIKGSSDYQSDNIRVRGPAIDRANDLMALINAGK